MSVEKKTDKKDTPAVITKKQIRLLEMALRKTDKEVVAEAIEMYMGTKTEEIKNFLRGIDTKSALFSESYENGSELKTKE